MSHRARGTAVLGLLLLGIWWTPTQLFAGGKDLGRIMPLGDSITWGVGSKDANGNGKYGGGYRDPLYTRLTANGYTFKFVGSPDNIGCSQKLKEAGQTEQCGTWGAVILHDQSNSWGVGDKLDRFFGYAPRPDTILLLIGVNDLLSEKLGQTDENCALAPGRLDELIGLISDPKTGKSPKSHLIVADLTPLGGPNFSPYSKFVVVYNNSVPGIVAKHRARGENVSFVKMDDALDPATDLADGLHPNNSGYRKMAEVWYRALIAPPDPAPAVALTAPLDGATASAPASFTIATNACTAVGTVSKVEFFDDAVKIGEATDTPYRFAWSNVKAGVHRLTAKATGTSGASSMSVAASVTVFDLNNRKPTVSLTATSNDPVAVDPGSFTLTANAADSDGTVTKVEFFANDIKLVDETSGPYKFSWTKVPAGTYRLTAKATDNGMASAVSSAVDITVKPSPDNKPPQISISNPNNGDSFDPSASIGVTATATDSDGTISKVEFLVDDVLYCTRTRFPYHCTVTGQSVGSHALKVRATDNSGAVASQSMIFTVNDQSH